MSFGFDAPEDTGGSSKFLDQPGTYHLIIMAVHEGAMANGKPMTGGGFCATLSAVAGTVKEQEERELNMSFFNGKLDSKDRGEFARKKQASFFIAADLMTPGQLGQAGLKIDLQQAVGRQIVATLEVGKDKDGHPTKFLELSYANVYHVDDPRAANFPKCANSLALLPNSLRHDAAYFAKLLEKRAPAGNAPTRAPQLTASQLADL